MCVSPAGGATPLPGRSVGDRGVSPRDRRPRRSRGAFGSATGSCGGPSRRRPRRTARPWSSVAAPAAAPASRRSPRGRGRAAAPAIRAWPSPLACRRSSHQRAGWAIPSRSRSTRTAPRVAAIRRTRSLNPVTRARIRAAATVMTAVGSGKVKVRTVAPRPDRATAIASRSPITRSRSRLRRRTSLMPPRMLARSGSSRIAGPSCSARICGTLRPRTARLAYVMLGFTAARRSASRSAQPR